MVLMVSKGLLVLLLVWTSGVFSFAAKEIPLEILYAFSHGGWEPNSALVQASDSAFYGTTRRGGTYDSGTVYRLATTGEITVVASLPSGSFTGEEGGYPLTIAKDGQLYGVLREGGLPSGRIFRITQDGVCETVADLPSTAHTHGPPKFTGTQLRGPLLAGEDGYLYGATERGGTHDRGTIFRLANDGAITKLADFGGTNNLGAGPTGALIRTSDGSIFGTTRGGGSAGGGTVFKLAPDGTLSTLVHFGAEKGELPELGLFEGRDGKFYGATTGRVPFNNSKMFSVTPDGVYTVVASLPKIDDQLKGSLVVGVDGIIYGLLSSGSYSGKYGILKCSGDGNLSLIPFPDSRFATGVTDDGSGKPLGVSSTAGTAGRGAIFTLNASGELSTTGEFTLPSSSYPTSILRAADGTLYGSTQAGGPSNDGTLFKISPDGSFVTLATFDKTTIGSAPQRLCFGADGLVYGLTSSDRGSLFKLNQDNTLSVLHNFVPTTGIGPVDITLGADGAFYVPTSAHGPYGGGTILRIAAAGSATLVHSFSTGVGRPSSPDSKLFLEPGGTFLGTLNQSGQPGTGIIYRLDLNGALTLLGSYSNNSLPLRARLLHPADGNVYADAIGFTDRSTLLRITPGGDLQEVNWTFSQITGSRVTGLSTALDRHLYGATHTGGPFGDGAIFRASLQGYITPLARRVAGGGSGYDSGPFLDGGDGYLYGAQRSGGSGGGGVIFRMKLPPAPFVSSQPVVNPTMTAATLQATGNNSLFYSLARFEYGTTGSYGFSTASTYLTEELEDQAFQASIEDLQPGTTYHYRAVLSANGSTYYSEDRQFTTAPNHAPSVGEDVGLVRADDSILLDVTANDQDEDGHTIVLSSFTQGNFGTVTREGNALRYTPGAGFAGTDSFTYTISDPFSSTTATVNIRNPLHAVQGIYRPRLLDHRNATSGTLKMTLNPSGEFDARIRIRDTVLNFSGILGLDGVCTQTFETARGGKAVIRLQLDTAGGTDLLSGTATLNGKSYSLTPEKGSATAETASAFAGRHNAVLLPPGGSSPQGQGWITIIVRPNGNVRLSGVLGDGSPFTAGGQLRGDGIAPVAVRLPAQQGDVISGELQLAAAPHEECSGVFTWHKPARAKVHPYPEGFEVVLNTIGSRYSIPAKGEQSLTYSTPASAVTNLHLEAGNLLEPTDVLLNVSAKDTITAPDARRLQMTINRSSGIFRGTLSAHGRGAKQTGFSGVILQSRNQGEGIYGRGSTAGRVTLQPR